MSIATDVRALVEGAPTGTFIRNSDIPGPPAAVNTALSRLSLREPDLLRVRKGLYWKGVNSAFGPGRPVLLDLALQAARGRGAGPSGWSAANALGFSSQVPAVPEVAVVGSVPTMRGVRFRRRNNLARRDLNRWEIALLEVLRDYPRYVEVDPGDLADRVRSLATEGKVRLTEVKRAAESEPSPALRTNLPAILDSLHTG
jgi:hypothetical protein